MKNKYNAWKSDSNGNPIEGTDRIFTGKSTRSFLKHIAYEEGIEHNHNDVLVRLKNGDMWQYQKYK